MEKVVKRRDVIHPTAQALMDCTIGLMEKNDHTPTSDEVLEASGISKGSMYHFFEDYSDLVESAEIQRFSHFVDLMCGELVTFFKGIPDRDVARTQMIEAVQRQISHKFTSSNFHYSSIFTQASNNERLRAKLMAQQDRLNELWIELFGVCAVKGWTRTEMDPRSASIIIQSLEFGLIVDQLQETQLSQRNWKDLVEQMVDNIFFAN